MDSEGKDTADGHGAEDGGPDGLHRLEGKYRAVSGHKEKKERVKYLL